MEAKVDFPLHPQAKRHLRNTQRLRAAAIREFARHGLHGAKVSNIVAAAHLTQPSFYRTWPSKEAAYNDVISLTLHSWLDAATRILPWGASLTLEERLTLGLTGLYTLLVSDLELTHLVLHENSKNPERYHLFVEIYAQVFTEAQAQGGIPAIITPECLAQAYTGLTERFFLARLLMNQAPISAAVDEVVSLLLPMFLKENS